MTARKDKNKHEMNDTQTALIKKTWSIFRSIDSRLVGDVFYSRLFYRMPSLRKMFGTSMDSQYKKLVDMLSAIVARLDRLDEIMEDVKALAIRHVGYGVKVSHYDVVGESLLWTLEQGLGSDWNDDVKEAWSSCYQLIADAMIEASALESEI